MNKVIATENQRVFMSVVGPSGSGKSQFVFALLRHHIFVPDFDRVYYFYQHYQPLYDEMQKEVANIEFIQGIDFDLIKSIPSTSSSKKSSNLLIFDDSCEELTKCDEFTKLATAGRHQGLNVIYIKHNLYHQSSKGRDAELQMSHLVLFKSPRDVQQINKLSQQLGVGNDLIEWYKSATSEPFGHLMIDLSPRTLDVLRFSSGFNPTTFYLPKSRARVTTIEDEYTTDKYLESLQQTQ